MSNHMLAWQKTDNQKKRLYLLAKRKGLALQLCRKHDDANPDYGTFRIINRKSGAAVHSARPGGYGLTIDQVEEYLTHHSANKPMSPLNAPIQPRPLPPIAFIDEHADPKGEGTKSQNVNQPTPHTETTSTDSRTPTLADRNVALLEAVAKNLEKAIEQYTAQLGLCRDMIRETKNVR